MARSAVVLTGLLRYIFEQIFPAAVTELFLLPGSVPWCQVAYWEGRERVGRLYPVCSPSLNIMGDTPHGDGLSLASLAAHSHTSPSDQVKRTREKIGLGKCRCCCKGFLFY